MKQKKVLIVGGGIAGCTLAFFLKKYGFSSTIVEEAPVFKRLGYFIGLRKIGLEVAEKMGLRERLEKLAIPLKVARWVDTAGGLIVNFDIEETFSLYAGLSLNRADLHLTIYDSVKKNVPFRFGQTVTSIRQDADRVHVVFSNDETDTFDFLIGAEGFHSDIRENVFGKGFEKYLGQSFFAFMIPNRLKTSVTKKQEMMNIRGPEFFITYGCFSQDSSKVGSYIIQREKTYAEVPILERKIYLLKKYGSYNETFRNILESIKSDEYIYQSDLSQVVMPTWHKGRVCLLGDAAYSLTLATGMGASMAMAGAYVLANALQEKSQYSEAFISYEKRMCKEIERLQAFGQRNSKLITGETVLPYRLMNTLLRIVPSSLISRYIINPTESTMSLD